MIGSPTCKILCLAINLSLLTINNVYTPNFSLNDTYHTTYNVQIQSNDVHHVSENHNNCNNTYGFALQTWNKKEIRPNVKCQTSPSTAMLDCWCHVDARNYEIIKRNFQLISILTIDQFEVRCIPHYVSKYDINIKILNNSKFNKYMWKMGVVNFPALLSIPLILTTLIICCNVYIHYM